MEGWLIQSLRSPEQSGISEMHLYDDQEVSLTMESYQQSCRALGNQLHHPPPAAWGLGRAGSCTQGPPSSCLNSMPPATVAHFFLAQILFSGPNDQCLLYKVRKMTSPSLQVAIIHFIYERSTKLLGSTSSEYSSAVSLPNTITSSSKVLHCLVIYFSFWNKNKLQVIHCILCC